MRTVLFVYARSLVVSLFPLSFLLLSLLLLSLVVVRSRGYVRDLCPTQNYVSRLHVSACFLRGPRPHSPTS